MKSLMRWSIIGCMNCSDSLLSCRSVQNGTFKPSKKFLQLTPPAFSLSLFSPLVMYTNVRGKRCCIFCWCSFNVFCARSMTVAAGPDRVAIALHTSLMALFIAPISKRSSELATLNARHNYTISYS